MKDTAHIPNIDLVEEDPHTGLSKEALKHAFLDNLFYVQGKFPELATQQALLHKSPAVPME